MVHEGPTHHPLRQSQATAVWETPCERKADCVKAIRWLLSLGTEPVACPWALRDARWEPTFPMSPKHKANIIAQWRQDSKTKNATQHGWVQWGCSQAGEKSPSHTPFLQAGRGLHATAQQGCSSQWPWSAQWRHCLWRTWGHRWVCPLTGRVLKLCPQKQTRLVNTGRDC